MHLWHGTPDTPRTPFDVSAGETVELRLGTYPIAPGQATWIAWQVLHLDARQEAGQAQGIWQSNVGPNSYWSAQMGPFQDGDQVAYTVLGSSPEGPVPGQTFYFTVGPKLYLALVWHQHQPLYKNLLARRHQGAYLLPWVRLHAIRDYYVMASRLESSPEVHVTINLTPVLLWQIEDYVTHGASDRALDLTLTPARRLSSAAREELLASFFEANWHTQIFPSPRYRELFAQRQAGAPFALRDLTDLQMWFNLAWFAPEFQEGEVLLPDGQVASVRRFIAQGQGYTVEDLRAMVEEQRKILRNIVSIHRRLQDRGQLEVATTPFYHPILPLLYDTNLAFLDRPGTTSPPRFHRPEDAQAQVTRAVAFYQERFGRPPRGMWPAEGAVGQAILPLFIDAGVRWIASDQGVLARSGQYGYRVDDPQVLCRVYRGEDETGRALSIFFRDTLLSNRIGFAYAQYPDATQAAADFLLELKARMAVHEHDLPERIVSVILDGENPWGAYRDQGRAFLAALYQALSHDPAIRTVTCSEYLEGNPVRRVPAHPSAAQEQVSHLAHASWIDEAGSRPGADLGTWIGEAEENRAWALLQQARDVLDHRGATPDRQPLAFASLWAAEGSDWFWWFGDDQSADQESLFDDLFRQHLRNVYRALRRRVPRALAQHIVPHAPVWTFTAPIGAVQTGDCLIIRTNCPGVLHWGINQEGLSREAVLTPTGGVMAGVSRYTVILGPFDPEAHVLTFRFACRTPGCPGTPLCQHPEIQQVWVHART